MSTVPAQGTHQGVLPLWWCYAGVNNGVDAVPYQRDAQLWGHRRG